MPYRDDSGEEEVNCFEHFVKDQLEETDKNNFENLKLLELFANHKCCTSRRPALVYYQDRRLTEIEKYCFQKIDTYFQKCGDPLKLLMYSDLSVKPRKGMKNVIDSSQMDYTFVQGYNSYEVLKLLKETGFTVIKLSA